VSRATKRAAPIEFGAAPYAILLPPEVLAAAAAKSQRRNLLGVLVFVLVAVVGAYIGVSFLEISARTALALSQVQTTALLQEQTKYAPVQVAQAKSAGIQADQKALTVHEIAWRDYLVRVQGTLPRGATITSVGITADNPVTPATASVSPLASSSIAVVVITVNTPHVEDAASWIGRLSKLDGYAGATPTNLAQSTDGGYDVTLAMAVDDSVVDHRFDDAGDSQ
jgi:hypothetical protein